jgi:hypothetical protein
MGGSAFASGPDPLRTPRVPLAVYLAVKSRCETILKQLYTHVATPIEGPGKRDFGDVDFLVTLPIPPLCSDRSGFVAETIGKALGALRIIEQKGSPTRNFALPWPKDFHGDAVACLIPQNEGTEIAKMTPTSPPNDYGEIL